jgi:hypothetical protein
VARQPSGTGRANESPEDVVEEADLPEEEDEALLEEDEEAEESADDDGTDEETRSEATAALWTDVRVEPVEIALPRGAGFTLRAYRPSTELQAPEVVDTDDDLLPPAPDESELVPEIDEEELTRQALAAASERREVRGRARGRDDEDEEDVEDLVEDEDLVDEDEDLVDEDEEPDEDDQDDEEEEEEDEDEAADEDEDEEEAAAEPEPEEVPVFLSAHGKLLLFRTADSLVEFIRSDAEHDLTQLDTWSELRSRVQVDDIVPLPEDTYELDLVVENLRGGPDAWDYGLLIQAGELARDIGYAMRSQRIISALSAGSPLDDLDEALRAAEEGGIGRFFARRKARKIGAETAALGWRTIIGKISALADWRD